MDKQSNIILIYKISMIFSGCMIFCGIMAYAVGASFSSKNSIFPHTLTVSQYWGLFCLYFGLACVLLFTHLFFFFLRYLGTTKAKDAPIILPAYPVNFFLLMMFAYQPNLPATLRVGTFWGDFCVVVGFIGQACFFVLAAITGFWPTDEYVLFLADKFKQLVYVGATMLGIVAIPGIFITIKSRPIE